MVVRRTVAYIIRSRRAGSQGLLTDVQRAVWSLDPSLPLADVRTLEEIYSKSMERTSFTLVMLAIAGAMALLIGLVGIYGVISYSVSQRRREIGIRMALGARPRNLTRIFVADGFVLALIGVACGLAGAAALTRVLGSPLFDVIPLDPLTYASVSILLIAAAVTATLHPGTACNESGSNGSSPFGVNFGPASPGSYRCVASAISLTSRPARHFCYCRPSHRVQQDARGVSGSNVPTCGGRAAVHLLNKCMTTRAVWFFFAASPYSQRKKPAESRLQPKLAALQDVRLNVKDPFSSGRAPFNRCLYPPTTGSYERNPVRLGASR